jgi:acyl carrier protein
MDNTDVFSVRAAIDDLLAVKHTAILDGVRRALAETLGLGVDDIRETDNLEEDLSVQSLDYMDLFFRLERDFKIRIPPGSLRRLALAGAADASASQQRLNERALTRLEIVMPELDVARLSPGGDVEALTSLFTVDTVVRLVAWRLAERDRTGAGVALSVGSPASSEQSR